LTDAVYWLRAGVVGRPHGLDGSFHVGQPVPELLTPGAEVRIGEHIRRVDRLAGHDRRPIMRLEGCTERAAAEPLRGQEIRVPRDAAPTLGPDEWWAAELEGCAVLDGDQSVGVVTRLLELPSCEVLEVTRDGGRAALLVPLIRDAVRAVDVERRVIDVDLRFLGER